jgi:glucose-1-phosphate adenylyltransferase
VLEVVKKKKCIAMILAGGQGSRLYSLTQRLAKPAVPFGGKYRIIDFPLSNCVNSGIDTVGVLTQYQPLILNEYIGNGQPWDLDRAHGGVFVLPPYQKSSGSDWYTGTANAIYQNMQFINRYDPEYVLILGGDHIYKMDYAKMLAEHIEHNADCTIAVQEVPREEASRMGIMSVRENGQIYEFEEKPKEPKSLLASMGIYIFSTGMLQRYLQVDDSDPKSSKDFGKNILPAMLEAGTRLFAHRFSGYWKDVGTIDSLWEANMDLIDPPVQLDMGDHDWRIYSRNPVRPPSFLAPTAMVQNSIVTEGTDIAGTVDFSVIFAGVTIEEGAVVRDSIVMPGATIKKGATVQYAILAENCVIGEGAAIGKRPEWMQEENKADWGVCVVASGVNVGAGATVPPKAMQDIDIPPVLPVSKTAEEVMA